MSGFSPATRRLIARQKRARDREQTQFRRLFTYENQQQRDYELAQYEQRRIYRHGLDFNARNLRTRFRNRRRPRPLNRNPIPRFANVRNFQRAAYLTRLERAPRLPLAIQHQIAAPQYLRLRRATNPRLPAFQTLPVGPPTRPSFIAQAAPYVTSKNAAWALLAAETVRFGYKGFKWSYNAFKDKRAGKKVKRPSWYQFF